MGTRLKRGGGGGGGDGRKRELGDMYDAFVAFKPLIQFTFVPESNDKMIKKFSNFSLD